MTSRRLPEDSYRGEEGIRRTAAVIGILRAATEPLTTRQVYALLHVRELAHCERTVRRDLLYLERLGLVEHVELETPSAGGRGRQRCDGWVWRSSVDR
jgi:hypothetical protein